MLLLEQVSLKGLNLGLEILKEVSEAFHVCGLLI
jgi:hypothetical protein